MDDIKKIIERRNKTWYNKIIIIQDEFKKKEKDVKQIYLYIYPTLIP